MNIVITTERLYIRPLSSDSTWVRDTVDWLNDPLVVRFSEQRHKKHTEESQVMYIKSFTGEDQYLGLWFRTTSGAFVGTMSVHVDTPNRVANVGIMIGKTDVWGQGVGKEAWIGVCNQLFSKSDIRKIEAGCMSCNKSMISLCHRYQMNLAGVLKDHFLYHSVPMDLLLYEKFK